MRSDEHTLDLNLLRVFDVVMRLRSVSAASRELNVTPSAVSHALTRLRRSLNDELFYFVDAEMRPTQRALELRPSIHEGLLHIDRALSALSFEPARSRRSFRISVSDYAATVILPPLLREVLAAAPGARLRAFPENRADVIQHIDEGQVGFAVGWFRDVPSRMRRATVLIEREAIVARVGHPLSSVPVTKDMLLTFPHAVVDLMGDQERSPAGFMVNRGVERRVWIERILTESGDAASTLDKLVVVTVPHYLAIPPILEGTDMLATMPERLAQREALRGTLCMIDLPYEPLSVPVEVIWHSRSDLDTGLQWLIGKVLALFP